MKICSRCKIEKNEEEFYKNKTTRDGLCCECKACRSRISKEFFVKYYLKKPYNYEEDKNRKLKYTYGISLEIYKELLESQNGKCAICGTNSTGKRFAFHVDHDHKTGKVRGLLCSNCNSGIGNLRDDISLLEKAIEYLAAAL